MTVSHPDLTGSEAGASRSQRTQIQPSKTFLAGTSHSSLISLSLSSPPNKISCNLRSFPGNLAPGAAVVDRVRHLLASGEFDLDRPTAPDESHRSWSARPPQPRTAIRGWPAGRDRRARLDERDCVDEGDRNSDPRGDESDRPTLRLVGGSPQQPRTCVCCRVPRCSRRQRCSRGLD